jgi:hypothetical protein
MGHAEQQERLGAQFGGEETTVNQVILEYHNVMFNENQYDLVETGKPLDQVEIRTFYNRSNLGKHKDKTWDNLYEDAVKEFSKNKDLLDEIYYLLNCKEYTRWKEETTRNLISEYYQNLK